LKFIQASPGTSSDYIMPDASDANSAYLLLTSQASDATPDLDYFGIWPDEQGKKRKMAVSEFRIEVVD